MLVKQVAFDMPLAIQKGLDDGMLVRCGGVIRDMKGHIVKHLDEVPIPKDNTNIAKIAEFASRHKAGIGIIAIVTVAAIAGTTYIVKRNKKNEEIEIPKCVADFNEALTEYLDSIKSSTVSEDRINKVMVALEAIEENQSNGNISITFSFDNAKLLIDLIRDYTVKLTQANSMDMPEDDLDKDSEIDSLRYYLNIQKQVFEKCA